MRTKKSLFSAAPQLANIYVGGQNSNTHLAENRLSSDFCDWSEVTDGLLGEAGRHRNGDSEKRWYFRRRLASGGGAFTYPP